MVPGTGIEPVRPLFRKAADFKSGDKSIFGAGFWSVFSAKCLISSQMIGLRCGTLIGLVLAAQLRSGNVLL